MESTVFRMLFDIDRDIREDSWRIAPIETQLFKAGVDNNRKQGFRQRQVSGQ